MTFGRQRPARDVVTIAILLTGFTALAAAFLVLTRSWLGLLLPLAYLAGLWSAMRGEVRQLELRPDALVVRTFFGSYTMPRAHITRVVRTTSGPAVDVLNGRRYELAPLESDPNAVADALDEWFEPDR